MKKLLFKYYPVAINIYTIWMLYMLFFAFNRDVDGIQYKINPYPFQSISNFISITASNFEILKNLGGNVVLFIPYGFLGILYPKLNHYKYLLLTFFIGINYIEFSQYIFNRGFAEFDDVLLNTFGMTLGFFFYQKSKVK